MPIIPILSIISRYAKIVHILLYKGRKRAIVDECAASDGIAGVYNAHFNPCIWNKLINEITYLQFTAIKVIMIILATST